MAHKVSTGGGIFDDLDRVTRGALVTVTTTRRRLALVTCEDWNGYVYLGNHVVIARPVHTSLWHEGNIGVSPSRR